MAIKSYELELVDTKMITDNVKHLVFKRMDNEVFEFIPGQFITFLFDVGLEKPKRRSYSIATIPDEQNKHTIEIAVAYVEGGIATKNLFQMKKGDHFTATGPAGRLVLRDEPLKRLILVGTGTGIAPYRSMLPNLADIVSKHDVEVEILLGVQYRQDALYANDFLQFAHIYEKLNFTACLSRETKQLDQYEHKGYVQSMFDQLDLNPDGDVVYLCGNPDMIDQSYERLKEKGFDIKNVRREKYISSN